MSKFKDFKEKINKLVEENDTEQLTYELDTLKGKLADCDPDDVSRVAALEARLTYTNQALEATQTQVPDSLVDDTPVEEVTEDTTQETTDYSPLTSAISGLLSEEDKQELNATSEEYVDLKEMDENIKVIEEVEELMNTVPGAKEPTEPTTVRPIGDINESMPRGPEDFYSPDTTRKPTPDPQGRDRSEARRNVGIKPVKRKEPKFTQTSETSVYTEGNNIVAEAEFDSGDYIFEELSLTKNKRISNEVQAYMATFIGVSPKDLAENTLQVFPVFSEDPEPNKFKYRIIVPNDRYDRMVKILEGITSLIDQDTSPFRGKFNVPTSDPIWNELGMNARSLMGVEHIGVALDDLETYWANSIKGDNDLEIHPHQAKTPAYKGRTLEGPAAPAIFGQVISRGIQFRIPLWNSGFWIQLATPTLNSYLDLLDQLALEKREVGRSIADGLYSNSGVYLTETLMDFVIKHLRASPLTNVSEQDLLKYISMNDLNPIITGLAATCWPNGFDYARTYYQDDGTTKVLSGILDPSKCVWVDRTKLTPKMITQMSRIHKGSIPVHTVEAYREELNLVKSSRACISEELGVYINFRTPSIADHIADGNAWVNSFRSMIDESLLSAATLDEQNRIINTYINANFLGKYVHYIDSIEYDTAITHNYTLGETDYDKIVSARNDVLKMLEMANHDTSIISATVKGIQKYQKDTVVSITAIPTASDKETETYSEHPRLIPMDPSIVFFTLLQSKHQEIMMMNQDSWG